ncbi:MAG TPA: hypothetical protein VL501_00305 [Pyrinomonadaceae bacterium]|nr:hypothetical protein [Pyrinomonadaceae bacterium]
MKRLFVITAIVWCTAVVALAQGGGKAEPKRIEFAPGHTSAVLSATLGHDEEMEYVFYAKAGQKVTVSNPKTSLFDVRIFSNENDVETEFDSSRTFSLTLPADGDYMLFVRKKRVRTPARAKFSITLSIK